MNLSICEYFTLANFNWFSSTAIQWIISLQVLFGLILWPEYDRGFRFFGLLGPPLNHSNVDLILNETMNKFEHRLSVFGDELLEKIKADEREAVTNVTKIFLDRLLIFEDRLSIFEKDFKDFKEEYSKNVVIITNSVKQSEDRLLFRFEELSKEYRSMKNDLKKMESESMRQKHFNEVLHSQLKSLADVVDDLPETFKCSFVPKNTARLRMNQGKVEPAAHQSHVSSCRAPKTEGPDHTRNTVTPSQMATITTINQTDETEPPLTSP